MREMATTQRPAAEAGRGSQHTEGAVGGALGEQRPAPKADEDHNG